MDLLRCKTAPGTSEALLSPFIRRLIVVSLFTKAVRNRYGNSVASNEASVIPLI